MKRNILLVANGDIDSDLQVIDAAAQTGHGVRRASTRTRPAQILRRRFDDLDVVIVDIDEHTQAISIIEALGCAENKPPVIALASSKITPVAYHHGATVCLTKPFSSDELAAAIDNVCLHTHPRAPKHPVEAVSVCTPKASLREPPD